MRPQVVVVGGGPAGSVLAGLLAGAGARVLLLDGARFPRPKPCGECLNPGAVAALQRLGLCEVVAPLAPVPLTGWRLQVGRRSAELAFPRGLTGRAVDRARFDEALLRWAARQGAQVREGAQVTELAEVGGGRTSGVVLKSGERLPAAFVVGADGLRSVVARRLGLRAPGRSERRVALTGHWQGVGSLADRGEIHVHGRLLCGLAPVAPYTAVLTLVLPASVAAGALAGGGWGPALGLLRRFPGLAERLAAARPIDGPLLTGPFDQPVRSVWAPGALLAGDAAGYYDPLTGQGIYRALRSAELAAPAVLEALAGSESGLAEYQHRLRQEFGSAVRRQRWLDQVVRRPRLLGAGVQLLAALPAAGGWLLDLIGDCPKEVETDAPSDAHLQ